MLFQYVTLTSFEKIKDERSSSNIYYLLKGRRSIQSIQDAYLFQLHHYYGIYQSLQKDDFDTYVKQLIKRGFLKQKVESIIVTNKAKRWLEKQQLEREAFFKGNVYNHFQLTFYRRLLLMIQVLTNYKMNNRSYIPIVDNKRVEQWVKYQFMKIKPSSDHYLKKLYVELTQVLSDVSNRQASLFVDRLTTYRHFGLTFTQLAEKYGLTVYDVYLHIMSVVHKVIYISKANTKQFPHLYTFFADRLTKGALSKSSQRTYFMLKSGLTAEQVAKKRYLSINTIYDHIIEIALQSTHFPYEKYVTEEQILDVFSIVKRLNTYRLKAIKQHVSEEMTYFQIRLILTLLTKER